MFGKKGLKQAVSGAFSGNPSEALMSKDEIAEFLGTSPEALAAFEESYAASILSDESVPDNLFSVSAKQAAGMRTETGDDGSNPELEARIVVELVAETEVFCYDGEQVRQENVPARRLPDKSLVTSQEILAVPEAQRPELSGVLYKVDTAGKGWPLVMEMYARYLKEPNPEKKRMYYFTFRQGLDIVDLDPVLYEVIGVNQNSMGHWFPQLAEAVCKQDFFRIPKTRIAKLPLPLLQLTRLGYETHTPATMRIVNEYCRRVFALDENQEYFIKTGTYSSKYEFRNCHVHGAKEVREIGEYLLFIHFQALQMASPLAKPVITGASTTNEWVVREYIKDQDEPKNPCIYNGMPLHTEYRAFVDFNAEDPLMGIFPYWDPDIMKHRFAHCEDSGEPEKIHDYIIYRMHEKRLMERFHKHKDLVAEKLRKLIPYINLSGQWSMDIMENGGEYWIIDMALASTSALADKLPGRIRKTEENWIPKIPKIINGGEEG